MQNLTVFVGGVNSS